jgi:quercetin dioxygenase-like cupin family protein
MLIRRDFIQTVFVGFVGSTMIPFAKFESPNNLKKKGIIKNVNDCETYFVRENTPITIHISKSDNIDSMSICTEELLPGYSIPIHKHLYADEMFYIIKGSGNFTLDNEEIPINVGGSAFVPNDTWHGLKNTGTELLIFTFGFSPSGFEDFFRQTGTLKGLPFKPKPQEKLDLLAKKYGMVYR